MAPTKKTSPAPVLPQDVYFKKTLPFEHAGARRGTDDRADRCGGVRAARRDILSRHQVGRADQLLGFDVAVELREALKSAGAKLEWVEFRGGHELPQAVLDAIGRFVRAVV